jgi:hypothetical protein
MGRSPGENVIIRDGTAMLAHWFILDTLLLANQANRDGMHANALALTCQCVEAIGVVELGMCGHPDAEAALLKWEADELTAGKLRAWLQAHVWPRYGTGRWNEPWSTFMGSVMNSVYLAWPMRVSDTVTR